MTFLCSYYVLKVKVAITSSQDIKLNSCHYTSHHVHQLLPEIQRHITDQTQNQFWLLSHHGPEEDAGDGNIQANT